MGEGQRAREEDESLPLARHVIRKSSSNEASRKTCCVIF